MDQSVTPPDRSERWLYVVDYEGRYKISDLGRVKSYRRSSPRILKPIRRYYNVVGLYKDGKGCQRTIHSLVAEAFIGPRLAGQEVCHGPGGRYDNRLANLSYGTRAENVEDMRRDGTMMVGIRVHFARLTDEAVLECRARAAAGEQPADLAREFGVSWPTMYKAVTGRTWRHLPLGPGPQRTPSVAARIAADLEGQIRNGELSAGSRLPRLNVIAARHSVAISTASNAIALLRERGLVTRWRVEAVRGRAIPIYEPQQPLPFAS